LHSPKPQYLFH